MIKFYDQLYVGIQKRQDWDRKKWQYHGEIEIRRSEFKDMEKYTGEIDVDVNLPDQPT